MSAEEIDGYLSRLDNMIWDFQRSLSEIFPNPNDEGEFQSKLYKNIYPETVKAIIAETRQPSNVMHKIITSVDCLIINF